MKATLPLINLFALIATLVINYVGNAGVLTGNTMATVSDRYANFFTPAGYAFSIWGLIYLGLLAFVVYTGRSIFTTKKTDHIPASIQWLFLLSCIANSCWVLTWLSDQISLSVFIMIVLLIILLLLVVKTRDVGNQQSTLYQICVRIPFAVYAGWVSVALIANTAAWLTKINWDRFGLSPVIWTIGMIAVAGLINVLMVATRHLFAYGMVGIWALIAIAVANQDGGSSTVIYTCYIVAAAILLSMLVRVAKKRSYNRNY